MIIMQILTIKYHNLKEINVPPNESLEPFQEENTKFLSVQIDLPYGGNQPTIVCCPWTCIAMRITRRLIH